MVTAAEGQVNAFRTPPTAANLADPDDAMTILDMSPLTLRTKKIMLRRPRTRPPHLLSWAHAAMAAQHGGVANASGWIAPSVDNPQDGMFGVFGDAGSGWEDVEVDAPDVTDRQTLLTLAKMASNAYTTDDQEGWFPMPGHNHSTPIGWEPDADGLRGHIFADDKNTTVIVAIKGTSAGLLGSGGPTSKNDKFNVSAGVVRAQDASYRCAAVILTP
jgi:lipase ATG15